MKKERHYYWNVASWIVSSFFFVQCIDTVTLQIGTNLIATIIESNRLISHHSNSNASLQIEIVNFRSQSVTSHKQAQSKLPCTIKVPTNAAIVLKPFKLNMHVFVWRSPRYIGDCVGYSSLMPSKLYLKMSDSGHQVSYYHHYRNNHSILPFKNFAFILI